MLDPRFKEVLEFIDELDDDGVPSTRAKIALKIKAYGDQVDIQRKELVKIEEEVGDLQANSDALAIALDEMTARKNELVSEAQDAAVRAAMAATGGASAQFRKLAQETRSRIAEFEKDYEQDSARLAQSQASLVAKKQAVKDQRGNIVRRLNTMSSLAERAGLEFGTELMQQQPTRPQPRQPMAAAPRVDRRRPRRIRVRRRRAS